MKSTLLGITALALAVGAFAAIQAALFLGKRPADIATEVVFEVQPGKSFKAVATDLKEQGLITDELKFRILARIDRAESKVRVGEYVLNTNMTPRQVLAIITSGKSLERAITIQEGFNVFEIADQLERQGLTTRAEFLNLVRDPKLVKELLGEQLPSLEGYLFPETYHITKYAGVRGLVKMMVNRFLQVYNEVPESSLTRHQLVTLASIVEKETGAPEERPIISSVFHNRLSQAMRLQTDPTVIYGKFVQTGSWDKNISKSDLLNDNPYNTYTRDGLPFGPIANPGREALIAAARPATTQYLFFVSRNDGTHIFTKTYKDHQNAVMRFQMDRKAREGKSWRDLNKRGQAESSTSK